jgi:hypothetical protein
VGSTDENKYKNNRSYFFLSEAKRRAILIQLKPILIFFLAWFQSFQLPSTQHKIYLDAARLVYKPDVSFRVCTQL